ncbi:KH domain-containing protein [Candidatus Dojkabacteria bacterium]|uniref:RNA-binding protein KhpA n=1 Tax=Candidatus Dojkabacteria bacterium TaxID=2099670 RepID=A0A5C7J5C7_9BACT|nr:MAG: KH domain-containing protein [Candidatus Dojkabacteria bacterium]
MKNTLDLIIKGIVDKTDEVEIIEEENEGVVNLTVKVNPEEMGKVIGKEGKVIRAIRNVLRIQAMKENKKIYVNLAEV